MGYIIFFIFLSGCIANPKLLDSHWDKHVRENPHQEDQIRAEQTAYQREWTYRQLYNPNTSKQTTDVNLAYNVRPYQKGSFGVGDKNSPFWIGHEDVNYLHDMTITIVCKDHDVPPLRSRYSHKLISWKLSEKFKGGATTNTAGSFQVSVETEDSKKFEILKIIIDYKVYSVPLLESTILEVEPEVCS